MALLAGLRSFTIKNSDSPCILKLHIQPFITGKVQGPNGNRTIQALCKMAHATGTMKNATGVGKPGEPVNNRPHLGDLILQKYEGILHTGFEDLKRFELIDRLEKPGLIIRSATLCSSSQNRENTAGITNGWECPE